jgi:hypothetical protein
MVSAHLSIITKRMWACVCRWINCYAEAVRKGLRECQTSLDMKHSSRVGSGWIPHADQWIHSVCHRYVVETIESMAMVQNVRVVTNIPLLFKREKV